MFERSLRELYWGSHNEPWGDYTFTSFGDHDSERRCLPDLLWRIRASATPYGETASLRQAREQALRCYAVEVARHLMGERTGDQQLQAHLEALRYTSADKQEYPSSFRKTANRFVRTSGSWIGCS